MHSLQPKHVKLKSEEINDLVSNFTISVSQLPKIKATDPCIPEGCMRGDVIKIERKTEEGNHIYYRVVA